MSTTTSANQELRYEADDRPSLPLTLGLGLQSTALNLAGLVAKPIILVTAAGASAAYLGWAVTTALLVSGISTIIQSRGFGRLGAGYILVMGSTSAFLAISITAMEIGGPALLATLIIVSSFVQFVVGFRMAALRRIFTPTVAGTVLMLIPVTIAPVAFGQFTAVPDDAAPAAAPVTAFITLGVIVVLALRLPGQWRSWAPAIGLFVGALVGWGFGIYDVGLVAEASWVGIPDFNVWPGLDLSFNASFWSLLPGFVIVTLVGFLDTLGDTIAIQRVSWRKPRAIDFRSIQGAIYADGLGNLLSGVCGTVPNTTYGKNIAIVELTGVAARTVGICVGVFFIVMAFLPKFVAILIAIPNPVLGAFLCVNLSLLFVFGLKVLISDGLDYRKSLIVGFAFVVGLGMQFDLFLPGVLQGSWDVAFGNGMTTGGIVVILLSGFVHLTSSRSRRLQIELSDESFSKVDEFLLEFAKEKRIDGEITQKLRAAGEETVHILMGNSGQKTTRNMLLMARTTGDALELEFIASASMMNLEDQLAALGEGVTDIPNESEAPLRLLRHYASQVSHQQYHDTDIATVRIEFA